MGEQSGRKSGPASTSRRAKRRRIPVAQGQATKEEAVKVKEAFDEVFRALPKSKTMDFIGHANDIYLFLEAAARVLPTEKAEKKR